ncbi:membrane protein [Xylanibacter ruminicola]|uniref:Lipoprotein n=2 Tax=Xylanibacter ruminicola TaxID=839 RepID=D5EWA9_XYLR2|nr:RagB/SusD family nutrient uptake outer membrane protein [Xylanibacter ruminicola]ADE83671.1 putative lipoprotein [Xylanibacter ruminicola 23]GJG32678.1 membrane protein [Xylanibacter ruminicola]SEH96180.1 Starch-binding associating with outer membrane [Xylanibacter ruminicola]
MKKIFSKVLIAFAAGSISLTSCTDLDETLYDRLNETNIDLSNEKDLSLLLSAVTAQYRYLVEDWFGMYHLLEESCDQYMVPARPGVGWGDAYINLHKHNWGPSVGQIYNPWQIAYRGIGYANSVIDAINPDDPAMVSSLAHARFFRAMFYYHLFDMFRNIPLQTTQNVEAGYLPQQVSPQEMYDFIVQELIACKEGFGDSEFWGYGNKYAASMALAKMYLNKNVYLGTSGNDGYEACLAEVESIINSGKYSLAPTYKENFAEDLSKNPEVIFVVPGDRTHTVQFGLQSYCFPQSGIEAYGSTAPGYNGSCAIPQWIRTYDEADKRLADTWAGGPQYKALKQGDTYIPNGDKDNPIMFEADDWTGTGILTYNLNVHSIDKPGAYQQEGYRLHKYEIIGGTDDGTTADDVAIFRYTDVLMMKAECLLRLGRNKDEAASLVTQVRARSFDSTAKATRTVADLEGGSVYAYGHDEYTVAEDAPAGYNDWSNHITTYEGGADIELGGLLDDLGWEFCCELHRRQDLLRFKMKDGRSVWDGKSWFCKDATSTTTYDIYSIPDEAMKANISLKQNPGYSGAE